jgi:hypothetical protein
MSAQHAVILTCDECGAETHFVTQNIGDARRQARRFGWKCNMKPTTNKPATYSETRDECCTCSGKVPRG